MKIEKAFILKMNEKRSHAYAKTCAESCDKVGLPWEYFENAYHQEIGKAANGITHYAEEHGIKFGKKPTMSGGAACATVGHFIIWKKIIDQNVCGIVLEHDALMLHKPEVDIPDDQLVCLGYKVRDPENYKHEVAGAPQKIVERKKHGGAHAYALTPNTAKVLLGIVSDRPKCSYIDNQYFLSGGQRGKVTLGITDPIAAIGWLRESTIWSKSAVDNYAPILDSFKDNYDSTEDLGIKER